MYTYIQHPDGSSPIKVYIHTYIHKYIQYPDRSSPIKVYIHTYIKTYIHTYKIISMLVPHQMLFDKSMEQSEKANLAMKRVNNIIEAMTYITYRYINKGQADCHVAYIL